MELFLNLWGEELKKMRWVWWIVIIINLLRLIGVFSVGGMPQDFYYYFYTEHPSWSYFDHPAGVMVMIKLFTTLFGKSVSDSEAGRLSYYRPYPIHLIPLVQKFFIQKAFDCRFTPI